MNPFSLRWQEDIVKPAIRKVFQSGMSERKPLKEFFLMITELQDYDKSVNPTEYIKWGAVFLQFFNIFFVDITVSHR